MHQAPQAPSPPTTSRTPTNAQRLLVLFHELRVCAQAMSIGMLPLHRRHEPPGHTMRPGATSGAVFQVSTLVYGSSRVLRVFFDIRRCGWSSERTSYGQETHAASRGSCRMVEISG